MQTISMFEKEEQATLQARIYADSVHRWILHDKERFLTVSKAFMFLADKGAPIQQGRIHSELVRHGYHISDNAFFANDRNNYPTLVRYLRAFYPELKKHIAIRQSAVDSLTLKAVPFGFFLWGAQCQNRPITRKDWQ